jgi:hypothetical protein
VIGIDRYQHWPALNNAVADATGIRKALTERFGFEAPPALQLTDAAATRDNIAALIEEKLPAATGPDDTLVLFYAGHGRRRVFESTAEERGYLAPVGARSGQKCSDLIAVDDLLRNVARIPARHVLVVLDACHSGIARDIPPFRAGAFSADLASRRSRKVIVSARGDQVASDAGPVPGHSLFTGVLLRGLAGEADDGDLALTTTELFVRSADHRPGRIPLSWQDVADLKVRYGYWIPLLRKPDGPMDLQVQVERMTGEGASATATIESPADRGGTSVYDLKVGQRFQLRITNLSTSRRHVYAVGFDPRGRLEIIRLWDGAHQLNGLAPGEEATTFTFETRAPAGVVLWRLVSADKPVDPLMFPPSFSRKTIAPPPAVDGVRVHSLFLGITRPGT